MEAIFLICTTVLPNFQFGSRELQHMQSTPTNASTNIPKLYSALQMRILISAELQIRQDADGINAVSTSAYGNKHNKGRPQGSPLHQIRKNNS
jgi:hypothetical protein